MYEIAFAIGRRKRAYLIRHQGTAGDKAVAREAGIFDTLGYHEYSDQDDLVRRLTSNIDLEPLTFSVELDHRAPVYLIEPPAKGIAVTAMIARLKKARYRYRSFIPGEDVRLSAVDAIRQVASSSGVLVTLEEPTKPDALVHNIRSMFVAGFADGMGKPLLVLCPAGTDAPLDVRDDVKHYRSEGDITDHIADFVLEVTDHLQQDAPPPIETGSLLQSLRIGDPTAENEMATLSEYYLQTDEYQRALHGSVNLAVGRKGSGKTALFIQLRDKIRRDKRNVVVDLRPEGYQLIKLKEDILAYLSEGSRQHLIIAFWEYLILLEVAYKLLEKDQEIAITEALGTVGGGRHDEAIIVGKPSDVIRHRPAITRPAVGPVDREEMARGQYCDLPMRDRRDVSEVPLSDKLAIVGDYGPPRELSLDLLQNDVRNDRVVQKVVEGLLGKA